MLCVYIKRFLVHRALILDLVDLWLVARAVTVLVLPGKEVIGWRMTVRGGSVCGGAWGVIAGVELVLIGNVVLLAVWVYVVLACKVVIEQLGLHGHWPMRVRVQVAAVC